MVRRYKKETIARNLINSAWDLKELNYLDKALAELFDRAEKNRDGYQHLMEAYNELHSEYLDDKKKFIKKYSKPVYSSQKKLQEEFLQYEDIWTKIKKARRKVKKKTKSKKK
jgi:predicted  nucleic acid-binding Zn-ribbon protein